MNPHAAETEKHSPHKLLSSFTQSKFVLWIGAALVLHVLIIGGLSLGYIRDTWIDPEGAKARKEAMEAAAKAEADRAAAKTAVPATGATNTVTATTNTVPTSSNAVNATFTPVTNAAASIPEDRRNTPMVKSVTAVAETNEIPKSPDDLGLSIKDTQVR